MVRERLGALVFGMAVAAAFALPSAAAADVTVSSFSVTPTTTSAGANPDVTINEVFDYGTSTTDSVKTTTLQIEPIRTLTLPSIEMKLSWKARSVSARTSEDVFAKVSLMALITRGISSAERAFTHQVPTWPAESQASSRYL